MTRLNFIGGDYGTVHTFQNTESKSAPLNLSGIPAAESLGPSNVTNSSKPTWPSPDETSETLTSH